MDHPAIIRSGNEFTYQHVLKRVAEMQRDFHLPFAETVAFFLMNMQYTRPAEASGLIRTATLIVQARRYLFTASARAMHAALMPLPPWEVSPKERKVAEAFFREPRKIEVPLVPVWIDLDEPQTYCGYDYRAVFFYPTLRGNYTLAVVGAGADMILMFYYLTESGTFVQSGVICPYSQDTKHKDNQSCIACQEDALHWGSWLITALDMIAMKYATSPDPHPFTQEKHRFERKEEKARQGGKSGKVRKTYQKVEVPYTVVSYDVSETPPPPSLHGETGGTEATEREHRENWITRFRDQVIFVRHGASERVYPLRRDGSRQEGKVPVKPHYIPMLNPAARTVIHRVTAKRYTAKGEAGG